MSEALAPERPTRRSCGAQVEHRRLLNEDPAYAAARAEIETAARDFAGRGAVGRPGITQIPVVVHVVWHSANENISDAQVQSQIDVLNRDYRMTNADIGQVPPVWTSRVGDARVVFALATTDPSGNPTNGITRTQTNTVSFAQQGNPVKSAATGGADPWPSDRYLNIWVCPLGGSLLGYAQFPGGPPETDGVVILHSGFGTTETAAAPFDRGRTATHEIGHVTRHPPHRARRGRNDPTPRTPRRRAHPHGANTPGQPGQPTSPAVSRDSTRT